LTRPLFEFANISRLSRTRRGPHTPTECGSGTDDTVELSFFYPNHFCMNVPSSNGSHFVDKTIPRFNAENNGVSVTMTQMNMRFVNSADW
jgi:hypothetical protein